jgi:hypothetical protein
MVEVAGLAMVVAGDECFEDPPVPTDKRHGVASAQRKPVQFHACVSSVLRGGQPHRWILGAPVMGCVWMGSELPEKPTAPQPGRKNRREFVEGPHDAR